MNRSGQLPKDQVDSLRTRDVQHYLTSRGWIVVDQESTPAASVYHHPQHGDAEILLPLRHSLADYSLRMADVVLALSAIDQRPWPEILNLLSGPPSDILKLCVVSAEATLGNLPLDDALQLFRSGRDLLLSAACAAIRPQPFYPERNLKQANDFIKECRFGQTERGSFVANIIAPVPPAFQQTTTSFEDGEFPDATEPFARRVTTRLMHSLGIVDQTLKTTRLDPIFNGVEDGVSANLCEALAAMKPRGDRSRVDIRMSWSRSRPRLPQGLPQLVSFSQGDFPTLEEAGRKLRERATPRRDRFVGKVFSLQSEIASLIDDHAGRVVVRTEVGGRPARVKLVLNRDDYRLACDAHRDDRRVAVTGIIHHDVKIRIYELSEPSDFQVLDQ